MALLFFQKTIFTPLYGLNSRLAHLYVNCILTVLFVEFKVVKPWPNIEIKPLIRLYTRPISIKTGPIQRPAPFLQGYLIRQQMHCMGIQFEESLLAGFEHFGQIGVALVHSYLVPIRQFHAVFHSRA